MGKRTLALLALSCPCLAGQAPESPDVSGPPAYAALPVRDLSGSPAEAGALLDGLRSTLEARGATFAAAPDVERALRARRIRYTDSASAEEARYLGETLGVHHLLASTLLESTPGPSPRVSMSLRVLDAESGKRIASSFVSLRGEDSRGWLGLGAITDVARLRPKALDRLLEIFGPDGAPLAAEKPRSRGWSGLTSLGHFHARGFDPLEIDRIAVLPLANRTNHPTAGPIVAELLAHEWFRGYGVEVVEPSELRAAMVRKRVRSLQALDNNFFETIGGDVETRYFLLGSVDVFNETVFVGEERLPEVEISVRMLDASNGRVVAASSMRRRGDDYSRLLGLGTVRDLYDLSRRAAHEMIAWMGR